MASKAKTKKPARTGSGKLVVVESPTKARTIGRILGKDYNITASYGHIRDLPTRGLQIDVDNAFAHEYVVPTDKRKVVDAIRKLGKQAGEIFLATDPDREGEAIAWHIADELNWNKKRNSQPVSRVVFHEITKGAVEDAFENARLLDDNLVEAQKARRVVDRVVGYKLSPLLGKKVQRGLSAGRVQSVALRQIVDREKEIIAFVPEEYWTVDAQLTKDNAKTAFTAALHSIVGNRRKLKLTNSDDVAEMEGNIKGAKWAVLKVKATHRKTSPPAPFTTSTLQQEAGGKLRFSAKKTMRTAQQLYEGVSLSPGEDVGLITYMRTDSVNLAASAVSEARGYIAKNFGEDFLPDRPRVYRTKAKGAQEAHEAIRPTSIFRTPQSLKARLSPDQFRLYDLIWRRTLSCQMADYRYLATAVDITAQSTQFPEGYLFRATGVQTIFAGFRTLYAETSEQGDKDVKENKLPALMEGDALNLLKLQTAQKFTQPPRRYTEATLVKRLEELGIGRPSTYEPTLSTLTSRRYVEKEKNHLKPTELGVTVSDLLSEYFPVIMDAEFTASMEESLDQIARGEREWLPFLEEFYQPFDEAIRKAATDMPSLKVEEPTDEVCSQCGKPMVIKSGRYGRFLACTGFPKCKATRELGESGDEAQIEETCHECGSPMQLKNSRFGKFLGCTQYPKCKAKRRLGQPKTAAPDNVPADEDCANCGSPMLIKNSRYGRFIGCSTYPKCRNTKPLSLGIPCPACGGDLAPRRARGRRFFIGCQSYPDCDYIHPGKLHSEPCPTCGGSMVVEGQAAPRCGKCAPTNGAAKPEPALNTAAA